MKWMRERDALIAQTLAFVQSVTGKRDAGQPLPPVVPEVTPAPPPPADLSSPVVPVIAEPEPPNSFDKDLDKSFEKSPDQSPDPAIPSPPPLAPSDFQSELRARIASFRAHQERFNREREAYFSATIARLRAELKDGPPPGPRG